MPEKPPAWTIGRGSLILLAAFVLLALATAELGIRNHLNYLGQQQRQQVLERAAHVRGRLETAVNSTVYLAHGLSAFIRSVEQPTDKQIHAALKAIASSDPRIRNIGLAPDNVLQHIYPREGNESAIGLRYVDNPAQWPSVKRAMDLGASVLAGPVDLVQGGRALINRTPVTLESSAYWGMISVVIRLDALIESAGISPQDDALSFAAIGAEHSRGSSPWIFGQAPKSRERAVQMQIPVPGGSWTLFAEPIDGWGRFLQRETLLRASLYAVILVVGGFLFLLTSSRARAHVLADELHRLNDDLTASNEALEYLSRYDPLTNVANRRHFDEVLEKTYGHCRRHQLSLTVLMIDVDRFKDINDNYGHSTGDACLVRTAALILNTLRRADDFAARYGGEEFIVLAVGLNAEQSMRLAERIRLAVSGTLIAQESSDEPAIRITVSIGLCCETPNANLPAETFVRRADEAMYAAKQRGRNRVLSDIDLRRDVG